MCEHVMLFLERLAGRVALKARAKMESSSSLRVGIDTRSTTVELLCIAVAPCKSHPTYKVKSPRRLQCTVRRSIWN